MPISQLTTVAGSTSPWIPVIKRSTAIKRDALNHFLVGTYTSNAQVLAESDWVYLQLVLYAVQIHPWTVAQVDALGPIGGRNAARWTMEGPTSIVSGEPDNCSIQVDVAHSLTATPGTDWREWEPTRYKLRSFQLRFTISRSSLDFDFRVYRFGARATRVAPPQMDVLTGRFFSHG